LQSAAALVGLSYPRMNFDDFDRMAVSAALGTISDEGVLAAHDRAGWRHEHAIRHLERRH
jgi:hypothetical protein